MGSLTASTLAVDTKAFQQGHLLFQKAGNNGIENHGNINASNSIPLLSGQNIHNTGRLTAGNTTHLAVGDKLSVALGNNVLQATLTVDASAGNNVGNSGRWLLNPNNITIQGSGTDTAISNVGTTAPWLSTNDNAIIVASTGGSILHMVSSNGISTPNGRWVLYSGTPNDSTINLTPTQTYFNRTFTGYPSNSLSTTGNLLLYRYSPTLTVIGNNFNRLYGDSNPTLGYTLTGGLLAGHTSADPLTGNITTTALHTSNVGTYSITQGSLTTTSLGYTLQYTQHR